VTRVRAVLAHREFRLLFWGQAASVIGDAVVIIAIGLFVADRTGSATDTGFVLAAYTAPLVLFLLVGGVVADRLPRQRVVVATDWLRCVLHAVLAVLIATDTVETWHMIVIGILFGTAEAFFRPAISGLTPQTVPEELIQPATAAMSGAREGSSLIGPIIAAALVLGLGGATAFALDAATFAVSGVLLARVRPRQRGDAVAPTSPLTELREGWVAVRARAWVWATIAAFSLALFFAMAPFFALGALVADHEYGSKAIFGVVEACFGGGTIAGSLLALRWRPRLPLRSALLWALTWPASLIGYGLGLALWVELPLSAVGGFGVGLFGVWWETALAERIPPHILSRVSAYDWMGSLALLPLGYIVVGPIADALGPTTVMTFGPVVALAAIAAALIPREVRRLERIEPGTVSRDLAPALAAATLTGGPDQR